MNYKVIILKIIKENQPLGIHKLDRLFHEEIEYSISWLPIVKELEDEEFIGKESYSITQKGLDYLQQHAK